MSHFRNKSAVAVVCPGHDLPSAWGRWRRKVRLGAQLRCETCGWEWRLISYWPDFAASPFVMWRRVV